MASYKIPQDVEADDKLLGPFTFRQFIFLIIATISAYLTFAFGSIHIVLAIIPLPFLIVFGILGIYRRDDQPVEIYLMALLQFYLKPRKRIWSQEGAIDNVVITAPKREEKRFSDGLSQDQVKTSLKILAQVIDTRGWSSKNVDVSDRSSVDFYRLNESDRLVMPQSQQEPVSVHQSDDMFDAYNPMVQHVDQMVRDSAQAARQHALDMMHKNASLPTPNPQLPTSASSARYNPYPEEIHQARLNPASKEVPEQQKRPTKSEMTASVSPDILRLSQNNDRMISSIAKEADQTLHAGDEISLRD